MPQQTLTFEKRCDDTDADCLLTVHCTLDGVIPGEEGLMLCTGKMLGAGEGALHSMQRRSFRAYREKNVELKVNRSITYLRSE